MRKGLLALMVFGFFASAAPAQTQSWMAKMFGAPENLTHDFGVVPRGSELHHTFVITNIYAVPMTLTQFKPECGCVSWKWNGEDVPPNLMLNKCVLQPRQSANIDVYMDGRKFFGPKAVKINASIGTNFISSTQLLVTAMGRADVVCNPGQVKFPAVARGEMPTATVDVEYAGGFAWAVTDASASKDAPFETSLKELYRRPGQVGYQLKVVLKKDAAPGAFHENVFLKTNEPGAALVPVLVEGVVQSALEVTPNSLTLGDVKIGEALTRRVVVRGNKPLVVTNIEAPENVKLGVPLATLSNNMQMVTFEVKPTVSGPFRYEVKLKTDMQDAPILVVIDGVAGQQLCHQAGRS